MATSAHDLFGNSFFRIRISSFVQRPFTVFFFFVAFFFAILCFLSLIWCSGRVCPHAVQLNGPSIIIYGWFFKVSRFFGNFSGKLSTSRLVMCRHLVGVLGLIVVIGCSKKRTEAKKKVVPHDIVNVFYVDILPIKFYAFLILSFPQSP